MRYSVNQMFLSKDYILTAEFAKKLNISINNFSKWYNTYPDLVDRGELVKLGDCTFFRKTIKLLYPSWKKALNEHTWTDFSNILPLQYLKTNFSLNEDFVTFGKRVKIAGKTMFKFNEDFVNIHKNKVWYKMSLNELNEALKETPDLEYFQTRSKTYVVYY